MSTHHLGCCCLPDVPGGSCEDSCFASSYSLSGITGTYHYERTIPTALDPACACPIGVSRSLLTEYFVDITFSQNATETLTRAGSTVCCYEARGDLTVSANVRIVQYSWCCQTGEYEVNDQSFQTTEIAVPFCFTMQCETGDASTCGRTIDGPDRWRISLSICDFPLATSADFIYIDGVPANCPSVATTAHGLQIGGAVFSALAKLKAPDILLFNQRAERHDFDAANRCGSGQIPDPVPTSCADTDPDSIQCMPGAVYHAFNHGNFAVWLVDEYSEQDKPDPCSLDCLGSPYVSAALAFVGSGATLVPCINVEANWSDLVCDYGAIRSGGWTFEIG